MTAGTYTYVDRGRYVHRAVRCSGTCGMDTRRRDPSTGGPLCATCDQRQGGGRCEQVT